MYTTIAIALVLMGQAGTPDASPDAAAKIKAQALLKEGTSLFGRGEIAPALAKFEAAYEQYPSAKLQFNIGQADRELGRPAEAVTAFEKFLALVPNAEPEVLAEARQAVTSLGPKLGRLKILGGTSGAEVLVDGKVVGTVPMERPVWVVPGRHTVEVRNGSLTPISVTATEGQIRTIALEAAPAPPPLAGAVAESPTPAVAIDTAPQESPKESPQKSRSRKSLYVWIAAAGTIAFGTAAMIAGIAANGRFADLQGSCGQTAAGCTESQIDTVKSRATVANVFWILTGVSAATGVALGVSVYIDHQDAGVSMAWKF